MTTKIFVNLPVKDLKKSIEFYKKLGFSINPQFTDETGACVVISDDIYVMLLTGAKFKGFTKKSIADSRTTVEAINAISVNSKQEVDKMHKKVLSAGGKEAREPQDYGFMYGRTFEDLDGHIWEVFWMDESRKPQQ